MTMQNYLDARYRDDFTGKEKELYTVTFNKGLSEYITHQLGCNIIIGHIGDSKQPDQLFYYL